MTTASPRHRDCRNHAPLDVTKGLCHRTKELVPADAEACSACDLLPRCGNCRSFQRSADVAEMGLCLASTHEPKFFAYPDMVAVTCAHHRP